jgi:uncharacterized protein (DUF924 family)
MSSSLPDLSTILTPTLYTQILSNRLPYPRTFTLNFTSVAKYTCYRPASIPTSFNALVGPPLKTLSLHSLSSLLSPDFSFLTFLAPPTSSSFPEQALALQLLLDQGPRSYCSGIDERWAIAFFDPLNQKFMKEISSLAKENSDLDPRSKKRWVEELGVSYDFYLTTQMWFYAPWVHSECLGHQRRVAGWLEGIRIDVEKTTGTQDPYRKEKDELMKDLWAFPKMFRAGPPKVEKPITEAKLDEQVLEFEGEGELKKEQFIYCC